MPQTKRADNKVVETTDSGSPNEWTSLVAALLTADKHLRCSRSFRERVLAVHVLDEIAAERNKEEYAKATAEQRREEYLEEVDGDVGILSLKYIQRRQSKYGTGHNYTGRSTNTLNNDILAQSAFAMSCTAQAHGDDGNGNGRLKDLAYLQPKISGSCREEHRHDDTP